MGSVSFPGCSYFSHSIIGTGINTDLLPILAKPFKSDHAIHFRKKGVIASDSYIGTGMNFRSSLPDQDISGQHKLSVSPLGAKTL